ncbi:MAG: PfkB family carbohydrate kinase [bacterium]
MKDETHILILNTAVLDLRSPDFNFVDSLVGAGGLAKCATRDMPSYTQAQVQAYVEAGCATAGGPGNTAPLVARAGLRVAVGVNLGKGECGGLDVQGRFFYDTLTRSGVDMTGTVVHPTLPTGTTFIHEVPGGERGGIAYFPNANNDFDFEAFKPLVLRLKPRVVYYMYSGLSERGDANNGKDLATFMEWCRSQGCVTIADSHTLTGNPHELIARGQPVDAYHLLEPLLPELDIFFTSADEARLLLNTLEPQADAPKLETHEHCLRYLDFVAERFATPGRTHLFGVTVKNGAYAKLVEPSGQKHDTVFCESRYRVGRVIDLVGAGDSFRAGLVAYVAQNRDAFMDGTLVLEEAVQMGNLMATLYITASLHDRYASIPAFESLLRVVRSGQTFATEHELRGALAAKNRDLSAKRVLVGFGFGPIQAGLFAKEARDSGAFSEIVIAEIDPDLVAAVRNNTNHYSVNVAWPDHVETVVVKGVTLLNPLEESDRAQLVEALGRATEIVTSLPSVAAYTTGGKISVAQLIADGLAVNSSLQTVVYTAENNNHAAELLEEAVRRASKNEICFPRVQFLNTVIGKMSQVLNSSEEILRSGLAPIAPGFLRAFLVESFNRILVSRIRLPGFVPGIKAFEEKDNLLPFEEAKLFGHNAAHTMLGFLGSARGAHSLAELREDKELLTLVRKAFLEEAGAALISRYEHLEDSLFTTNGFCEYVDDLLLRMTNPYLSDTVARAIRDPLRKLGFADRLFGALRLCLANGVEPGSLATGALAGLETLALSAECPQSNDFEALRQKKRLEEDAFERMLRVLWDDSCASTEVETISRLLKHVYTNKGESQ